MTDPKYDVCFSFAYGDQDYVDAVAKKVRSMGLKVFYSGFKQTELWGVNLYDYLTEVYSKNSRYCVIFISKHYANSLWTDLERQSAQARAFRESEPYILPARFDMTKIPGIEDTLHYINLAEISPEGFADLVYERVTGNSPPKSVAPLPNPPPRPLPEKRLNKRLVPGAWGMVLALLALLFGYSIYQQRNSAESGDTEPNIVKLVQEKSSKTLVVNPEPLVVPTSPVDCNVTNPHISCLWKKP